VSLASNNNLDWHAAQAGQQIIKTTKTRRNNGKEEEIKANDVENLATKALGVLQENGVYAAFLYLYSRSENEQHIAKPAEQVLKFLTDAICNDLDRLLLVKQLWEQTLIYARYGAKARGVEEDAKKAKTEIEKAKSQP